MVQFLEKIIGGGKPKSELEYLELDLSEFEEGFGEPVETYVRVAELSGLEGMPEMKKEIYNGNILLIDVSKSRRDKMILDRAIKDLKQVVGDVHGDIAMVGENQVLVTPRAIRINRTKLISGKK